MNSSEKRAIIALASIFSLRMLGLFMILPVFALYAQNLSGVTPTLIGVAIGAYGLTQALFQIPFGVISDQWGRKRIIAGGLIIFIFGSIIAALSTSIWGVIAGRALQGAGAISGPIMALAADLTREDQRTKAMAIIGMSIGASFALAIVAAPTVDHLIGVPGIFWLIGILAGCALILLFVVVPNPINKFPNALNSITVQIQRIYQNSELRRINFGIFALHAILTANWVVVPLILNDYLPRQHHWWIYLPVLVLSAIAMTPFIMRADRPGFISPIFLGSIALLGISEFLLIPARNYFFALGLILFLFFTALNLLEAILPTLVSKLSPPDAKGTAMGIYSTAQFFGAFIGGALGGWIHGEFGISGVFILGTLFACAWLIISWTSPPLNLIWSKSQINT